MSAERLLLETQRGYEHTTLARAQLLSSLRDADYRQEFVRERVHSSVALQIRALRAQRNNMTQKELGDALGMAQTWISKLEDPDYGKMTVATLLRLANAFDADLEIKFRPFSKTLDALPTQGPEYYRVRSFEEEFGAENLNAEDMAKVQAIDARRSGRTAEHRGGASSCLGSANDLTSGLLSGLDSIPKMSAMHVAGAHQEQYGNR